MGYHGVAHLANESFKELDDLHHIGHVDAAFRMHNAENPDDHDHIYFFLVCSRRCFWLFPAPERCDVSVPTRLPMLPRRMTRCSAISTTLWRTAIPKRSRRTSRECPRTWMLPWSVPKGSAWPTRFCSSRVGWTSLSTLDIAQIKRYRNDGIS